LRFGFSHVICFPGSPFSSRRRVRRCRAPCRYCRHSQNCREADCRCLARKVHCFIPRVFASLPAIWTGRGDEVLLLLVLRKTRPAATGAEPPA
jgi:hypothetical protein